jgi:hypothetical protein
MSRKLISGAKAFLTNVTTNWATDVEINYLLNTDVITSYYTDKDTSRTTNKLFERVDNRSTSHDTTTSYTSQWVLPFNTSKTTTKGYQDYECGPLYEYNITTNWTTEWQVQNNVGATDTVIVTGYLPWPTDYGAISGTVFFDINGNPINENDIVAAALAAGCQATGCGPASNLVYNTTQYYATVNYDEPTVENITIITTYNCTRSVYVRTDQIPGVTDPSNGFWGCYSPPEAYGEYCGGDPTANCQSCTTPVDVYQDVYTSYVSFVPGTEPGTTTFSTYLLQNTVWLFSYDASCSGLLCSTNRTVLTPTAVPAAPTYDNLSRGTSRQETRYGQDCGYVGYTTDVTTSWSTNYSYGRPTSRDTATEYTSYWTTSWTSAVNTDFTTDRITSRPTERSTARTTTLSQSTSRSTGWYTS